MGPAAHVPYDGRRGIAAAPRRQERPLRAATVGIEPGAHGLYGGRSEIAAGAADARLYN